MEKIEMCPDDPPYVAGLCPEFGSLSDPDWWGEFYPGMKQGTLLSRFYCWPDMDLNTYLYWNTS